MVYIERLVLRDNALLRLKNFVKVSELLAKENCLVAHHWIDSVQISMLGYTNLW